MLGLVEKYVRFKMFTLFYGPLIVIGLVIFFWLVVGIINWFSNRRDKK